MSNEKPEVGSIGWIDLTIPNADTVRSFYETVVGWKPEAVSMGEYNDYTMSAASGKPSAGICHARGVNQGLPAQWLIYIVVEDLETSVGACTSNGGKILVAPKEMGAMGRYCVIQDPAGAVAALFQSH